jgi:hypothetical protein
MCWSCIAALVESSTTPEHILSSTALAVKMVGMRAAASATPE